MQSGIKREISLSISLSLSLTHTQINLLAYDNVGFIIKNISPIDLGCVWIGSKRFQEIIFRKTRVFGNYGK